MARARHSLGKFISNEGKDWKSSHDVEWGINVDFRITQLGKAEIGKKNWAIVENQMIEEK